MKKEIKINAQPGQVVVINVIDKSAEKEHYSITEFAKLVGVSRSTVYRKIQECAISTTLIGKSIKIEHKYLTTFKK